MPDITNSVKYVLEVSGAAEASQELQRVGGAASETSASAGGLAGSFKGLTGQFALGGVAAGVAMEALNALKQAVQQLVTDSIRLTMAMADLTDAMGYVYSDAAPALIESLDSISASTGYARSDLYGLTRDIGAMIAPMGLTSTEAAAMSAQIVQSSADAAAALGMELPEAAGALEAALRGSSRAARQLGIDISEEAVNAELLRMGITESADAVDEATLIQARYNIAIEATSRYQGAAAAEMNTLEGAQRRLDSAYEEMATQLGDAAAPALTMFLDSVIAIIPSIGLLFDSIGALVELGLAPIIISFRISSERTEILTTLWNELGETFGVTITPMEAISTVLSWINDKIEQGGEILRTLLGIQGEEITALTAHASALDTLYVKQGTFNEQIQNATIAELEYVTALMARMNVMGAMDPAIEAANARLETLRAEVQALLDTAEAKRQEGKDAGLTTGASSGTSSGPAPTPEATSEERKMAQALDMAKQLVQLNRERARIQEDAAEATKASLEEEISQQMEWWEAKQEELRELEKDRREDAAETAGFIVDTGAGMLENMHDLDDYVEDMIKRWAAQLLKAFALQTLTDAFTGGLGGQLLGGSKGGKFLK